MREVTSRLPFGLDRDGLMILDDERGASDAVARRKAGAQKYRRRVPGAAGEEPRHRMRLRRRRSLLHGELRLDYGLATATSFDLDGLDLDVFLRTDEAEPLLMRDLEQGPHAAQAGDRDGECAVGVGVAKMRLGDHDDLAWFHTLPHQLLLHLVLQRGSHLTERG